MTKIKMITSLYHAKKGLLNSGSVYEVEQQFADSLVENKLAKIVEEEVQESETPQVKEVSKKKRVSKKEEV